MDYFGKNQLSIRPRRQTITRNVMNNIKSVKLANFAKEKRKAEKAKLQALLALRTKEHIIYELNLAREGQHPELIAPNNFSNRRTAEHLERVDIAFVFTMRRIQAEYDAREAKITQSTEKKLADLFIEMEKDVELLEKRTEIEYSCLEINKPTTSVPIDVNKKTLRGRGGVLIEPPTYFNATPKTAVISVNSNATFLLQETVISDDLEHIFSTNSQESYKLQNQRIYDVQLQKLKFVYEGKTYKQGEEVYVENNEYGKIPAKAENVTELVVSFKASQSWDIRQIHASHSDLAEGRVKVYKRKNN